MKSLRVRKFSMTMTGIFVACLAFAAHGASNVFDDAVFWFHGGKDCVDANGYIQQGEFFDDLNANDTNHLNHKMPMSTAGYYTAGQYADLYSQFLGNAAFRKEPVVFPALGTNIVEEMQVLHVSDRGVSSGGAKFYFPFSVNPRGIFASNSISNAYTIVSRIRLDELDRTNYLFRIGYSDSTKQGMRLGFLRPSTNYNSGCKCLGVFCKPRGGSKITGTQLTALPVPTNMWVDVAVVVGNGSLRVGIAAPQSLPTHNNPTIGFAEISMQTDDCKLLEDDSAYCLFSPQNFSSYSRNKDYDCFLGSVQQLAIWGRALDQEEVIAAFGMPRPALFRTGFDGKSGEFGGERTNSTQIIEGLGSWQGVWNTMQTNDTWTVNFTALRDESGLPQMFSIKSRDDSALANIEVTLNGSLIGTRRVAGNAHVFWPVAKNLVHAGANTLVIRRTDTGTGTFKMDAMELGGSFGVGTEAASTNDGRTAPAKTATGVPSAADPNPQHWPQELQPFSGVTNLCFRVWVDPDVVEVASWKFRTLTLLAARDDETLQGDEKYTLFVNGNKEADHGSDTSLEKIELDFAPGELLGGWNLFELKSAPSNTKCRWHVGYYRFETVLPKGFSIPPPGMAISIR